MAKRTYGQHCALARALDLVGERWTLLLVRELLSGPKRYRDLSNGLAGIGTNLLATRLRELEAAGIVTRAPHAEGGYALTERGRELEPAVLALARFGASELEARTDDLWRPDWLAVALRYRFRPDAAAGVRGVVEYAIDDVTVQARLDDGELATELGSPWSADATLTTDGETLLALGRGEASLDDPRIALTGDRKLLERALACFG